MAFAGALEVLPKFGEQAIAGPVQPARGPQFHIVTGREVEACRPARCRQGQRHTRLLIGFELQSHIVELPEFTVMADRIVRFEQTDDHVGGFRHHPARGVAVDIEQLLVGDQARRPDPEDRTPVGQMVQEGDTFRNLKGVMKRQVHHRRSQPDPGGFRRRHRQRHFRRRHGFPAAGMMFADMKRVVAEAFDIGNQIDIAVKRQRRVFRRVMRRHHEERKFHRDSLICTRGVTEVWPEATPKVRANCLR